MDFLIKNHNHPVIGKLRTPIGISSPRGGKYQAPGTSAEVCRTLFEPQCTPEADSGGGSILDRRPV